MYHIEAMFYKLITYSSQLNHFRIFTVLANFNISSMEHNDTTANKAVDIILIEIGDLNVVIGSNLETWSQIWLHWIFVSDVIVTIHTFFHDCIV